jgi:pantoate--beta-alanine ligase
MQICRTIAAYRAAIADLRAGGASIGLVPTMGALHAGHMALVAAAKAGSDRVVATIFVNPTQFGDPADLENYPRTEAQDLKMLREAGVDAVLIPEVAEVYPEGAETVVEVTRLSGLFHGAVRPGHFRGVATVVAKLFHIAQPDHAYFGQKDYQQLAVIRRMTRDLLFPIEIRGVPTVREADGLAMSSRNARLAAEDRAAAPVLHRALEAAEASVRGGAPVEAMARRVADTLAEEPRARLQGCDIVWADTFEAAEGPLTRPVGLMISAEFGPPGNTVLLIDQREIHP